MATKSSVTAEDTARAMLSGDRVSRTLGIELLAVGVGEARLGMIVTHDMWFARNIATRIAFCADGRIIEDGPPEKMFSHPQTERTREFLENVLHAR